MTGELRMELFGPGMTGLHKAGLAGLWMTLRSFEDDPAAMKALRSAGGSWILSETEVTLRWTGSTEQFFDALIKQSFRLYKDGLLWLPALGEPSEQTSAVLNECVLGTFLQHGKSRKSDAAANPGGKVVVPVDEDQYIITYHRIREYAHQTVRVKDARKSQQIVGWVYPGGAVRHSAYGDTAIEEPLSRFLPLLYSIVGVLYFVVRGKGRRFGNRTYAVVIPEIADLKAYADLRKHHAPKSIQDVTVSGPGEAALRLLVSVETSRLAKAVGPVACRVVTFGKVAWDKQQKKR
ncbi:MAG: type I-MYXAN CRISPR-associated Cas8a1/Cmx1, partial [Nitrososphaerales archaeon]